MSGAGKTIGLLIAVAAAAGLGAAAWNQSSANAPAAGAIEVAEAGGAVELASIEVQTVERTSLTQEIRVSGVLEPLRHTLLNAEVGGTIETLAVRVGETVSAGDVLVEIDTEPLEIALAAREASIEASRAQLSLAQATLERNRQLSQSGITSQVALLDAEANVLNLEAQIRSLEADRDTARIQLADAVVTAPFDGVISSRSVEPGQAVAANTELLGIVDLSTLEAAVAVPTSRVGQIEIGQTASLSVDGIEDRSFDGEIVRISPVAETGSRAVRVFVEVDNADGRLRGGMFATGTLRTGDFPEIIALPLGAIRRDDGGAYVLKAEDGRLKRQAVEAGTVFSDRGLVEVSSGLDVGEVVVTAPLPGLVADTEVDIAGL